MSKRESSGGRPVRDYRSNSKEAYERFCVAYPDIDLSYTEWNGILVSYNKLLRDYAVTSGEKVKLQRGLGSLAISGKKSRRTVYVNGVERVVLAVDWKKSKEVGKKVYNFNSHTDGYRYRWLWFCGDARFYMSDIWQFKPCRESSRRITEFIKSRGPGRVEIYKQWTRK